MQAHGGCPSLHLQTNGITFFHRMQVRMCSALDDRCLIRTSDSRDGYPQWFPLCERSRVWTWRTQRLSERNAESRSERYRTLGKGLRRISRLLAERAGRNGEEHHCEDDRGEAVRRKSTRGILLLFKRLRGPEQPHTHIPDAGRPTGAQVQEISIGPRPVGAGESRTRLRIIVRPDG